MLKTFNAASLAEDTNDNVSYAVSEGDIHDINNEHHTHVVATSTPQKDFECNKKNKSEGNFIGQGDQDLGLPQSDQSYVTSTLISNIFDMSKVERVDTPDDTITDEPLPNDTVSAVSIILDSYIDKACKLVTANKYVDIEAAESITESKQEDYNDHSFLVDVFGSDLGNNVAFYLDDVSASNDMKLKELPDALVDDVENKSAQPDYDQLQLRLPTINAAALYNIDAYLTLNRDYEQCSDDDGDPILQDPKGLSMHEITLLTANTSLQDLSTPPDQGQEVLKIHSRQAFPELVDAATSDIAESITGPIVKKTLARRCCGQGVRILRCLQGWWRRRTPNKRKEARVPGLGREARLLSPEARQRRSATISTSLIESRRLNSPEPSRDAWKFNTVSGALLNISQWRDYFYTTLKNNRSNEPDDTD